MVYKATINIEIEEWQEFIEICNSHKTNASKEVRAFIKAFKRGQLYEHKNCQYSPETIDSSKVDIDLIVDKVIERLEKDSRWTYKNQTDIKKDTKTDTITTTKDIQMDIETDTRDKLKSSTQKKEKNTETDTKRDMKTENTNSENTINSLKKTTQTQPQKTTIEGNGNLDGIVLEDWARQVYTHREVAKIEGVNKSTISRLWTGRSKGSDKTFWDRWEKAYTDSPRWWRVQAGKSTQEKEKLEKA